MSHVPGNMTCRCPACVNVALLSPTPYPLRPLDFPGLQTLSSRFGCCPSRHETLFVYLGLSAWSVSATVIC